MLKACIQEALAGLHHRPVDAEQIRKGCAQHRRHPDGQCCPGGGGEKASVPAINQHENHGGQHQHQSQGQPDGVIAVQQPRHQHLPHQQNGIRKGNNGTQSRAPGKNQQEQQERTCQQRLLIQPVVIRHEHRGNAAVFVADHHEGLVPRRKQLILRQ